jgi:hypothetical protein
MLSKILDHPQQQVVIHAHRCAGFSGLVIPSNPFAIGYKPKLRVQPLGRAKIRIKADA